MSETEAASGIDEEAEETGETSLTITAGAGVVAFIVVLAWAFQTAPFGAGINYWFGVVIGALVVGGVVAAIARRVQRMLG